MQVTDAPKLADAVAAKLDASPRIVNNWRDAWRWASMRSMGFSTGLLAAWAALPQDMRQDMPHWLLPVIVIAVLVFGMVGRVVNQSNTQGDTGS